MEQLVFLSLPQLNEIIQSSIEAAIKNCISQLQEKKQERPIIYRTRKELKELLHTSYPTVDKYTKLGVLQATYFGRKVLYKESDLDLTIPKVKTLIDKKKKVA